LDEKIAILKIGGPITDATARKTEKALRKLKQNKDVKVVVLRVDSPGGAITACETIFQELQDLPQKVVVSFGNVSASGGYYISANAERIFASPTTITGSIGVVMMRVDLRGLAKQYGVTFDSVSTSEMSGSFDPFYPINHRMKDNFSNYADRAYMHFKELVGTGREMDMDLVETVAQGRVWTGEQAKQIGLVDELGGLDRAIAFAQRNYTTSGKANVVSWPPKPSLFDFLANRDGDDDLEDVEVPSVFHLLFASAKEMIGLYDAPPTGDVSMVEEKPRFPVALSGMMLTVDENCAIRCLLQENDIPYQDILDNFPPSFWEG
jgi:signal peptide peptidase SppA